MLHRLSVGLLASAVAIVPLPLKAQECTAWGLKVMRMGLMDVIKPAFDFQEGIAGSWYSQSQ